MKKTNFAKAIRILSIPPIMVSALILILYVFRTEYFTSFYHAAILILLLGVIPVLAYPLQSFLPTYKAAGRDGQRKLAFFTNLIGYAAAFLWALCCNVSQALLLVCATYFFSVLVLTVCNKIHFKASGHASSFTGPLLILIYAFSWKLVFPCILIAVAIIWSSLHLKRHTLPQLLGGILACMVSFLIAFIITH